MLAPRWPADQTQQIDTRAKTPMSNSKRTQLLDLCPYNIIPPWCQPIITTTTDATININFCSTNKKKTFFLLNEKKTFFLYLKKNRSFFIKKKKKKKSFQKSRNAICHTERLIMSCRKTPPAAKASSPSFGATGFVRA